MSSGKAKATEVSNWRRAVFTRCYAATKVVNRVWTRVSARWIHVHEMVSSIGPEKVSDDDLQKLENFVS